MEHQALVSEKDGKAEIKTKGKTEVIIHEQHSLFTSSFSSNPRYITSSVKRPGTSILLAVVANDLSVE